LLLHQGMVEQKKHAIARVIFRHREQLVLLRPMGRLVVMEMLYFTAEVKESETFEKALPEGQGDGQEIELVNMLIKASTPKRFDLATYKDTYKQELTALIQAKIQGKEIVTPPASEVPEVINLMEALKKSLELQETPTTAEKPPRKMARSAGKRRQERKRKTS
jgi:DNA end-binding protein Ku